MEQQPYECGQCGAIIWSDDPFTNSDNVIICSECRDNSPFYKIGRVCLVVVTLPVLADVFFNDAKYVSALLDMLPGAK